MPAVEVPPSVSWPKQPEALRCRGDQGLDLARALRIMRGVPPRRVLVIASTRGDARRRRAWRRFPRTCACASPSRFRWHQIGCPAAAWPAPVAAAARGAAAAAGRTAINWPTTPVLLRGLHSEGRAHVPATTHRASRPTAEKRRCRRTYRTGETVLVETKTTSPLHLELRCSYGVAAGAVARNLGRVSSRGRRLSSYVLNIRRISARRAVYSQDGKMSRYVYTTYYLQPAAARACGLLGEMAPGRCR